VTTIPIDAGALVTSQKGSLRKRLKDHRLLLLIFLPGLIHLLIFRYAPIFGLVVAFQDYSPFQGVLRSEWVGLEHFREILELRQVFTLMWNTLMLGVYRLVFGFAAPILLALVINEIQQPTFKRVVQTLSYLPYFISNVVVVSIVATVLSPYSGLVNRILGLFNIEPIYFMVQPGFFRPIYTLSEIWKTAGWSAIIYLAALSNINSELYETAYSDGAGRLRQAWHVTLPGITPTIIILLILNIGGLFGAGFELAFLYQNSFNLHHSEILDTYIYKIGLAGSFGLPKYSFAAAIGIFQSVINITFLYGANLLARKYTEESLW
jgi:putative aldouronate transport system permease protein